MQPDDLTAPKGSGFGGEAWDVLTKALRERYLGPLVAALEEGHVVSNTGPPSAVADAVIQLMELLLWQGHVQMPQNICRLWYMGVDYRVDLHGDRSEVIRDLIAGSREEALDDGVYRALLELARQLAVAFAAGNAGAAPIHTPPADERSFQTKRLPRPPRSKGDQVHFTVTGPTWVTPGMSFEINLWAHLWEQRAELQKRAREFHGTKDLHFKSKGPILLDQGCQLSVRLVAPGLSVLPAEDSITWLGELSNACFAVSVPAEFKERTLPCQAIVWLNGLRIAQVPFVILLGAGQEVVPQIKASAKSLSSAFASYASEDENRVLGRIQGMQKILPHFDIFYAPASLKSGDPWQSRLREEILKRDIFYLFWSEAASTSKWVDWEWRCALEAKGAQGIDPVPLISPSLVPPPPELAALHFGDWTLAYELVQKAS